MSRSLYKKLIWGLQGIVLALFLSACGATGNTDKPIPYSADAQQACIAKNGRWEKISNDHVSDANNNTPPLFRCAKTFNDAGKSCTDSSQCKGLCLHNEKNYQPNVVVNGFCQKHDTRSACVSEVSRGVALPEACV